MSTGIGEEKFNIGGRLREERERLKLSQETTGTRIGTTGRTIKKYEGNETSPRADHLLLLSSQGFDIFYIVTGERLGFDPTASGGGRTPSERLALFIGGLDLSESDAELVIALVRRLSAKL